MSRAHKKLEKNINLMAVWIVLVISIAGLVELLPLVAQDTYIEPSEGIEPFPALQLAGRDIYVREGCYVCHSQQIRPFRSETERVLGQAVCTADYIGQISDPRYPDRLETLFNEFEESYRYQGMSPDTWPFKSYEALLRATPAFWDTFVQRKLNDECAGVWRHLEDSTTGDNPYMQSIERNLAAIRERIAALD